jgi:hypothetical protein
LQRELKTLTESIKTGDGPPTGRETVRENIAQLERRLAENQDQALVLQQPALEVDQAAQVLACLEPVFGSLTQVEQARFIRSAVQRADYDGGNGKLVLTLDPTGLVAVLEEQPKPEKEITK